MKEQGEEELLRVSGVRPRCVTASSLLSCGCGLVALWLSRGPGLWPHQQRGTNTSLHQEHKLSSLDSNGLGHQDSRAGRWSQDRLVVLGGKRGSQARWRGDSPARRKGLGTDLLPKHWLPAPYVLIPITIPVPRPCLGRLCPSPLPPCPPGHLPSSFMPSCPVQPPHAPAPLPGRIICYLFCRLRHIFILTQYNWRMPVGQY